MGRKKSKKATEYSEASGCWGVLESAVWFFDWSCCLAGCLPWILGALIGAALLLL